MSKLRPNMLQHFELVSDSELFSDTILGITSQWDSLITLKLKNSGDFLLDVLAKQTPPPKLQYLAFHEYGMIDCDTERTDIDELELIQRNQLFFEQSQLSFGQWIGSCRSLRRLEVCLATANPSLLASALESQDISLEALTILEESPESEVRFQDSDQFYKALASHSSLQELTILAAVGRKTNLLLEAVQKLANLRVLHIDKATNQLKPHQVGTLTSSLPHLKELSICNSKLDDQLWDQLYVPQLRYLKLGTQRKIRRGYTHHFTGEGIINWVHGLGPANQGLRLEIQAPYIESTLKPEECQAVEKELVQCVGGSFRSWRMESIPGA